MSIIRSYSSLAIQTISSQMHRFYSVCLLWALSYGSWQASRIANACKTAIWDGSCPLGYNQIRSHWCPIWFSEWHTLAILSCLFACFGSCLQLQDASRRAVQLDFSGLWDLHAFCSWLVLHLYSWVNFRERDRISMASTSLWLAGLFAAGAADPQTQATTTEAGSKAIVNWEWRAYATKMISTSWRSSRLQETNRSHSTRLKLRATSANLSIQLKRSLRLLKGILWILQATKATSRQCPSTSSRSTNKTLQSSFGSMTLMSLLRWVMRASLL